MKNIFNLIKFYNFSLNMSTVHEIAYVPWIAWAKSKIVSLWLKFSYADKTSKLKAHFISIVILLIILVILELHKPQQQNASSLIQLCLPHCCRRHPITPFHPIRMGLESVLLVRKKPIKENTQTFKFTTFIKL